MQKINLDFIFKISFEILSLLSKVMDKFQGGVGKDIFFDIFKHLLWILSITFFRRLMITKKLLKIKVRFISQLFLVQSFFKCYFMPKWGLKFYFEHNNYYFWQWVVKLIFKLFHILWRFITDNEFHYKNYFSFLHSH